MDTAIAQTASRALRIWIDARDPRCSERVFGMSLLERQLRGLLEAHLELDEVRIERAADSPSIPMIPDELRRKLPLREETSDATNVDPLAVSVADAGGRALLALEADSLIDPRLLRHVARASGSFGVRFDDPHVAVVRLEAWPSTAALADSSLAARADAWIASGALKEMPLADFPAYLPKLRRTLPPYGLRVRTDDDRERAERFLFESNYKGSTDFFTKHVYPPLVWRILQPLARMRVHPNWVSALNVVLAIAAIPLFAGAHWVSGLMLAYTMSVLDSVDGKLARLTFCASKLGHVLDHGLDVVHPPFWYVAWAWALSGADPHSAIFWASLVMTGIYVLDRLATEAVTRLTGKSIHAYAPIDVRMRTWISRRNINVPIFTLGLVVGAPTAAFAIIVAWQILTFAFHAVRLVQIARDVRGAAGEVA